MLGKAQIFLAACAAFIVAASSVGQVEAHSFPGNDHAFAARGKHHKAAEKWDKEWYRVVDTGEGRVRGGYNATSGTYYWLGVPFAASTAGSNRFMPPKPVEHWDDIRDATHYGMSCPQHDSGTSRQAVRLFGVPEDIFDKDTESEDCLNSNIYVGKRHWEAFKANNSKLAPVWLNVYGGSFEWGTNRVNFYQGDNIVNKDDIVVVNINFRSWIFGFPMAPQLQRKGEDKNYPGANAGMADVNFAVRWVYEHIAKFGGDPNKITMGGTSTGASLVDNWSFVNHNKPSAKYVRGLILQSGSMISLGRYFDRDPPFNTPHGTWMNVSRHVGCGTTANQKQFECMQHKPWRTLMEATFAVNATFGPAVDNYTIYGNYFELLREKRFVPVPALIGNNKDEGNAFLLPVPWLAPAAGPVITAEVFVCPTEFQCRVREGVAPTWRYRFSPSLFIPGTPNKFRSLGSYHGGDTAYAWDNWRDLRYVYNSTEDSKLAIPTDNNRIRAKISHIYREANVKFVLDPHSGLNDFQGGWPSYENGEKVGDIGYDNKPTFRLISHNDMDGLCPFSGIKMYENNVRRVQKLRTQYPLLAA